MNYFMPSSYQLYSMPYSQYYGNYASYSGGTSLWIQGTSGLTQYVTVPLGASLSLLAISPTGGNGYIYETAPGGISNTNYYYFNQYNQMTSNVGYASSSLTPVHFGTAKATHVDIEILWPDGTKQTLKNVRTNQVLAVREP